MLGVAESAARSRQNGGQRSQACGVHVCSASGKENSTGVSSLVLDHID